MITRRKSVEKKSKGILIPFLLLGFFIFYSCVTQRNVEYLRPPAGDDKAFAQAEFSDYKLKAHDELFIQISSIDEAAANVFSGSTNQQLLNAGTMQPYGASLMSYSVDNDGYLRLPIIGRIMAKDKTISDVSLELRDSLRHILNQPVVTVKLVNRFVSILGEVNNPGHFSYAQDKLTVYDAIGIAGDITEYGNRDEVILIRNEDGINNRVELDLTASDILSSKYYNLRPNDIIYVKPLRNKFWGMRQFPYAILFSTLTTGILLYSVVK